MSPAGFARLVVAVTVALLCHARGELQGEDSVFARRQDLGHYALSSRH
jgi:hypothetical protein